MRSVRWARAGLVIPAWVAIAVLLVPLLALLLMVEISLALLTRLNSQLQLMQISFPIKMLLSLTLLGWLLSMRFQISRSA